MRPLKILLVLAAASLALLCESCSTTTPSGTQTASALQTFDALYANAVRADDLVITTSTSALQSGLISAAQAQKILTVTDSVKSALDLANAAAQAGNAGTATANLAAALGPVAILSACLTTKPLTVSTFEACAVKLTPAVLT